MKAVKNRAELAGARAAHERDGAAMARFLAWFDVEAPRGRLTEIDAVEALETFRVATGKLKDISFPTIAGAGPNSAIPHYRVTEASNRTIGRGIFLIDSGAQYEDGTTDITRTIAVGRPTTLMRDRFTRVLKGHIAIACAVFPKGTSGAQIDAAGAERRYGAPGWTSTMAPGHGVGSYLSVHEGPQRIAKIGHDRARARHDSIRRAGLLFRLARSGSGSRTSSWSRPGRSTGAERQMLGFDTLTLAPIDLRLVEPKLMDARRDRLARRLPRPGAQGRVASRRSADAPLARLRDATRRGREREDQALRPGQASAVSTSSTQ